MNTTIYLPIRGFDGAKTRLAPMLDRTVRAALALGLASHTVEVLASAGHSPIVVSSSADVASWASVRDLVRIPDAPHEGLNGAARAATHYAGTEPWLILHADLPLLTIDDVAALTNEPDGSLRVIAPSYDGGTTALGGTGGFGFAYGALSFHRHLRDGSRVISRTGLQLDIDQPADIAAALGHPDGQWLRDVPGLADA